MKIIFVTFFLSLTLLGAQVPTNELASETSPYLLQHAHNPVHWMAWHKKAFERAKKENKPIFLSIGYSTCHWCHVMEEESFTNKKIAALLNKYFICIAVDREELPQIDALYQNIYKNYKGHSGGWPLNLFMTPLKKVFYITNYIPPKRESYAQGFNTLLPKLHQLYLNKKKLTLKIKELTHVRTKVDETKKKELQLSDFIASMKKIYDKNYPGFGHSKQFPEASKTALMLDLAELGSNAALQKDYFTLLDTMALHGLYDQVEGGFFRYSVDLEWEIPHFEKMLYTQAELLPLYVRGYALSDKKLYKSVVTETISMLQKRFAWHHLYWSASDADSKNGEGTYFTFTPQEITKALKYNVHEDAVREALGFSLEGNIDNRVQLNFDTDTRPKGFKHFQRALREIRAKRSYPFIDKKINTAWNAMTIEALYKSAYIDKKYAKMADENLKALGNLMLRQRELYHQTVPQHVPTQKGLLEDYAFFIGALIASYENSYDNAKLFEAEYLLSQAKEKFYANGLWYLSEAKQVKAGLNDKYYTSALSKMIQNIIHIAALKESLRYDKFAQKSLDALHNELQNKLADAPALARAYLMQRYGVVLLKSKRFNLAKSYRTIEKIPYPYLFTLNKNYNDYLVCTIRQCFSKSPDLNKIIDDIRKRYSLSLSLSH